MEKFELLLSVLRSLQDKGVLKHFVLVGSWCLFVYRWQHNNPAVIPATRTMDADILIPRRLPPQIRVDVKQLMEDKGFVVHTDYPSGFHRFVHPVLNFEFLTDAGARSNASVHRFKQLGITAQELRYVNILLQYKMEVSIDRVDISVPEPEAFLLHKLIVSGLRGDPEKARGDREAATGLLMFFENKQVHMNRLREIYEGFPKSWKTKVDDSLKKAGSTIRPFVLC